MSNPNPMHSRCGLEDCDCGYTIEKLTGALEGLLEVSHRLDGCPKPNCIICEENKAAVQRAREATVEAERGRVR